MPGDEARLLERLLTDRAFRRRFENDPVAVAREAGFPDLADELARADDRDGRRLDVRESKSSAAGVFMAAALEALAFLELAGPASAIDDSPPASPVPAPSPLPEQPEPTVATEPDPLASAESNSLDAGTLESDGSTEDEPDEADGEDDDFGPDEEDEQEGQDEIGEGSRGEDANDAESDGDSFDDSSDDGTVAPDSQKVSQDDESGAGDGSDDSSRDTSDSDAVPPDGAPGDDSTGGAQHPASGPTEQPGVLPPDLPADPSADAAAQHLAEFHYGFVRTYASNPNFGVLKAAGYNGILFHANDPRLGEAIESARAAGMGSVGIWAPANLEDPETYAHRLAALEEYKPDIVVPDVEIEGKGYAGSPEWKFSETFASLYRKLLPHQTWAVTVMANQDDFNYGAYTSRGAQVWPQTYGATYDTTFDPESVVKRVAANGVDPRLINPVLAPNQSGDALSHFASYALDDFQEKFPPFVPRAAPTPAPGVEDPRPR